MTIIPFEFQPYFFLAIIFLLFFSLYKQWLKPAVGFLFAVLILILVRIITPVEVLAGLSNPNIAIVVLLILITAGIRSNYNIEWLLDKVFGKNTSYQRFLVSMMSKVAILSSFVTNTTVVVLMTPYVFDWGRKHNISPSKLLIPLSYATIIGGMITIVGTTTTLVLNGFLLKNDLDSIKSMDLLIVGSGVGLVCLTFLSLFSDRLLPAKQDILDKFESNKREYLIEKRLSKNSALIGSSVAKGLRNLTGVYLVEIVRDNKIISPVQPNDIIQKDDILIFAGNTNNIVDLTLKDIGIELPPKLAPSPSDKIQVVEAVISANSSIVGKTIKNSDFRSRYDAAVVAVHRNGEKLSGKIGHISIKAGDVLLLYVGDQFSDRVDLYKDLYVIAGEDKEIVPDNSNFTKLLIVFGVAVILLVSQLFTLFVSLLVIFTMMAGMRLITLKNVKRDLDINLVIILVLSLALGEAMRATKTGELVADNLIVILSGYGNLTVLISLMAVTTILTSFITNVGAVAISFPLALALTTSLNIPGAPFYLGIAFAASAAFLTPIGYQTNLIVYGPGGYNFKDFFRIGLPTTLVYLAISTIMIVLLYMDVFM